MPSFAMSESDLLTLIVQRTVDAITIVDDQLRIQYLKFPAGVECAHDRAIGQPLALVFHPEENAPLYRRLEWVMYNRLPWTGRLRYRRCGDEKPVLRDVHIFSLNGDPEHFVIAEHTPHEEIGKQYEQSDIYLEISRVLGVAEDVQTLSAIFLQKVQDLLGVYTLAIGLLEEITPDQGYVIQMAYATPPWDAWVGKKVACSDYLRQSLDERKMLHLTNLGAVAASHCLVGRHLGPVQELLIVPLLLGEEKLGVLLVGNVLPLNRRQKKELRALSSMFARALHRQALHEDLNTQLELLKKTQAELVQTEKLASLGVLLAGVAHELNNPLTSIVLYTQLALENLQDHPAHADLEQVLRLARRATRVIRSMLDFSANRHVRTEPVYLHEALKESLALLQHELATSQVQLKQNLAADLPPVLASGVQVQQVFMNLIVNAIYAIKEKRRQRPAQPAGHIWVTATQEEIGGDPWVHLMVKDDGIGMGPETLKRIFDPFYTTRQAGEGTGLGLSICHGIVARYGGKIWAESEPQQGSTFHVTMPVATPEVLKKIQARRQTGPLVYAPAQSCRKQPYRLLVVDDEESIRQVFTRVLRRSGYEVETVADGETALKHILQHDYDLVLCDINIPNLSGDQIYAELAQKKPDMLPRLLFITGDTHSHRIQQFISKVDNPFLAKPFDLDDFLRAVQQALAGHAN